MSWTNSQHDQAMEKTDWGEPLTDYERAMLKQAASQAGYRGQQATKALQKDDERRRGR